MMRIATGIITAPRTPATLPDTLASLREAGFPTYRILGDEARSGCWQVWLRLLRRLVDDPRGATHFLLCEDDVIFARGLHDYLIANPPPAGAVANLFCTSECHRPDLMEWHEMPLPHKSQGSLALLLPFGFARKLAAAPPFADRRDGTDHNVGTFCRELRVRYVTHSPSLVLHAAVQTGLDVERGRDELRQAFCFAESINAYQTGEPIRPPADGNPLGTSTLGMQKVTSGFDGIGELPKTYFAHRLADSHSSRGRLPDHPHTLTIFRQAGA